MPRMAMAIAATAAAAGVCLSGCGQVEETLNRGGDTPCNDYIGQKPDKQRVTVTKFLKDRKNGAEPGAFEVDTAITAIDLLCRVQTNATEPIKNADLAGIFAPK